MASRNINDLHPILRTVYQTAAYRWNSLPGRPKVFLTATFRTVEEQTKLYAQGRTAPGPIVTWTMTSKHMKYPAEAFDIAFKKSDGTLDWNPDLFEEFARLAGSLESRLKWGGFFNPKDLPHFEI